MMESQNFSETLHHAPSNGVYRLPDAGREAMEQAARDAELEFRLINLEDCEAADEALELIAEGMKFPEWFGNNFDALYDCLTDLTWQDTSATVIVLTGCDGMCAAAPETWGTLINVFLAAAEYWRDEDLPFWVFIDMSTDGLQYLPAAE